MTEEWRAVVGFEGLYEVSDLGRVRSLTRRGRPGRVLSLVPTSKGYHQVNLSDGARCKSCEVHALVAAAFIGPRPAGQEVCHGDGKGRNNRRGNLRYDTPAGNSADRRLHGTALQGSAVANAKLTEAAVRRIRELRGTESLALTGARFGVSHGTIWRVQNGLAWRHV